MISRRASEIIRLALTMSQINNTDALSYRDKIDMLNQSYIRLYTDLNNSGELYYSKDAEIDPIEAVNGSNRNFKLPIDFWKLLEIGHISLGRFTPILRAPNSGSFTGYKIINNELHLTTCFSDLAIKYIPQPQKITFPKLGYKLPGNFNQAAYDSINDVIVLGTAGNITLIDRKNNNNLNTKIVVMIDDGTGNVTESQIPFILAISAGIIYIVTAAEIRCFDYELNLIDTLIGNFELYAHSIGWEEGIIIIQDGIIKKYILGNEPIESSDYWNFMNGKITKTDNVFIYSDNLETRDISEFFLEADSFVISDPFIYINKSGLVKVYDNFEPTDFAVSTVGQGSRKGVVLAAETNNETGYGVIFKDFYSGLNMTGFASDTLMNYPQNLFFDWITVDLAIKFRMALDIPTNELPALQADYWDILKSNISRDAFQSQRIGNAYA